MAREIMIRSEHALAEATRATTTTPTLSAQSLSFSSSQSKSLPCQSSQTITVSYAERSVIFDEKQCAEAIYYLVSGAVLLSKNSASGERQSLEIIVAGSYFGWASKGEYDCRAETLTRCIARRIDRSSYEASPRTQNLLTEQLIRKLSDDRSCRVRRSASERVASLLLSLPLPEERKARDANERVALTQSEMASLLGLAIETVCRVLREFKRAGAVSTTRRGRITIVDHTALCVKAGL
jgi:CRP/FNR family transcriptional regulator